MATITAPTSAAATISCRAKAVHFNAAANAVFLIVVASSVFRGTARGSKYRGSCILNRFGLAVLAGLPVRTGASDRLVRPWQDVDQAWQDYAEKRITAKSGI